MARHLVASVEGDLVARNKTFKPDQDATIVPNLVRSALRIKITRIGNPLRARLVDGTTVSPALETTLKHREFDVFATIQRVKCGNVVCVDGVWFNDAFHAAFASVENMDVETEILRFVKRLNVMYREAANEEFGLAASRLDVKTAALNLVRRNAIIVRDDGLWSRDVFDARVAWNARGGSSTLTPEFRKFWGSAVCSAIDAGRRHVAVHAPFCDVSKLVGCDGIVIRTEAHFVDGFDDAPETSAVTIWVGNRHVAAMVSACSPLLLCEDVAEVALPRCFPRTSFVVSPKSLGTVICCTQPWRLKARDVPPNIGMVVGDGVFRAGTPSDLVHVVVRNGSRLNRVRFFATPAVRALDVVVICECAENVEVVGDMTPEVFTRCLT